MNEQTLRTTVNRYTNAVDIIISHYGYEKPPADKKSVSSQDGFHAYHLHFITKGSLYLHTHGQSVRLGKNTFFLLQPHEKTEFSVCPKNPAEHYWCSFSGALADEYMSSVFSAKKPYCSVSPADKLKIVQCFEENFLADSYNPLWQNLIFTKNLFAICAAIRKQNANDQTEPLTAIKANHGDIVSSALTYINRHYTDPDMSVTSVAAQLHVNKGYLSNAFAHKMKVTFSQYLTQKRIENAIHLIRDGASNVSEIAYASGFNDPLYFSKIYKKYNLISPKEDIAQFQAKIQQKLREDDAL